ncbi:MAG: anti-sigma factor, partial [Gammaproteobacteria bacterium]
MNEHKYMDLIQAELDDQLSDGQRAELDTLLRESAEARADREEYRDLAGLLRQVPSRQPPESVRQCILAQI